MTRKRMSTFTISAIVTAILLLTGIPINPGGLPVAQGQFLSETQLTFNTVSDVEPSFGPDGNKIVFSSFRDGSLEVFSMNKDGSVQTQLTSNMFSIRNEKPVFFSDGTKIVFVSDRDGDREIFLMNADGTGQTQLTFNAGFDDDPRVCGNNIVFSSRSDAVDDFEIFIIGADGSGQRALTSNTATDGLPNFSPDCNRIVFTSAVDGDFEIFLVNPDGTIPQPCAQQVPGTGCQLTSNTANDGQSFSQSPPSFSPDGKRIVFDSTVDGDFEIFAINTDGTIPQPCARPVSGTGCQLTSNTVFDGGPVLNPAGSKIAYESTMNGFQVFIMDADGTGQTQLTFNTEFDGDPSFSPDGNKILFVSNRDGDSEIFVGQILIASPPVVPLWIRQFGTGGDDSARGVRVFGNVYVVGLTNAILPNQTTAGGFDAYARKYDPNGNENWTRQFGTSGTDLAQAVWVDSTGVYVAGDIGAGALPGQSSAGSQDAFVRKYDFDGNEIWTRQFGSSAPDSAFGLTGDSSGIYVSGQTQGTLPGQSGTGSLGDAFVRKYSFDGTELWTRQFGTAFFENALAVSADVTGVYVVGATGGSLPNQTSSGVVDAFARKYDSAGNEVWTRQFGTVDHDDAEGVSVDSTGVYVVGNTKGVLQGQTSAGGFDAFIRKYDFDGNDVWTRQFGTPADDLARDVSVGPAGAFMAGSVGGVLPGQTGAGGVDAYARKYDVNGNVVWTHQFGSTAVDQAFGISVDNTGVYLAGEVGIGGVLPGQVTAGGFDSFVLKLTLGPLPVLIPVTVTVIRFIQDQNPDPAPDTTGEFYARVSIGGPPFQDNREDALNATDISPFWTFTRQVNASLGVVPIEIQILDADLLDPDDVMDISPGNQTSVTLSLDLNTCEWTGASGANVGFSPGTSGRILFDVGCTSNGDIDLDGIPDGVERFGVLDENGFLAADLMDRISDPVRISDPCRPTVAVEIDYMEAFDEMGALDHTHRPRPEALKMIIDAFDNAPVSAVDSSMCPYAGFPKKSSGIVLILDVDDAISEQPTLTFEVVAAPAPGEQSFETVRDGNFDFAKAPYFRYSLWVHDLEPMTTASGIGELSGNEFIVSLGSWTDQTGTVLQQAGTLMHEIGHTLGLDHGGGDPNNFKPSYLSVMSYGFQTVGIINADGTSAGIDYSREALPTLDERGLSEMAGILGSPFLTRWSCPQAETRLWGRTDGSLDWDCNETINPLDQLVVGADINEDRVCITPGRNGILESSPGDGDVVVGSEIQDGGDGFCNSSVNPLSDDFQARDPATFQPDLLEGFDDWSNIDYVFRLDSADFDPGKSNLPKGKSNLPKGEELAFEQAQRIEAFWREVKRQISSSEEARPFYQGSSVQTFYTDTKMNPLPLDGEGNPKVDVILGKNGEVKGTSPGEVLVWTRLTNVAGEPISSVQFDVTLPADWSARPPAVVKGSIMVFFQFTDGSRVEITNRASITISGLNTETVSVSVSDFSKTGAKKNLGTGESILVSIKIAYALKGTIPSQQYPATYNTFATSKTFSLPLFQGTFGSETTSAFFVAHVKPRE